MFLVQDIFRGTKFRMVLQTITMEPGTLYCHAKK